MYTVRIFLLNGLILSTSYIYGFQYFCDYFETFLILYTVKFFCTAFLTKLVRWHTPSTRRTCVDLDGDQKYSYWNFFELNIFIENFVFFLCICFSWVHSRHVTSYSHLVSFYFNRMKWFFDRRIQDLIPYQEN